MSASGGRAHIAPTSRLIRVADPARERAASLLYLLCNGLIGWYNAVNPALQLLIHPDPMLTGHLARFTKLRGARDSAGAPEEIRTPDPQIRRQRVHRRSRRL